MERIIEEFLLAVATLRYNKKKKKKGKHRSRCSTIRRVNSTLTLNGLTRIISLHVARGKLWAINPFAYRTKYFAAVIYRSFDEISRGVISFMLTNALNGIPAPRSELLPPALET